MSLTVQSCLTCSAAHRHLVTFPFLLPRLTHLTQTFPSCRVYSTECTVQSEQYNLISTECSEIIRHYQLWDTDQSYRMRGPQKIYLSQSTSQSWLYWTSTDTCHSLHYHQSQHQSSNINHQTSNIEDKKFPQRCNRELNSI